MIRTYKQGNSSVKSIAERVLKELKIIKNDKHIQTKENLSKINRPLDDNMQGFQCNQCLKFIDFKDTKMHQVTSCCFQCKKRSEKVLKT